MASRNGRRVVITGMGALTPSGNSVSEFWNACAQKNLESIKNNVAPAEDHAPQILAWTGDVDAEDYLCSLDIRTKNLRDRGHQFHFDNCRFEDRKSLLSWLI